MLRIQYDGQVSSRAGREAGSRRCDAFAQGGTVGRYDATIKLVSYRLGSVGH